MHISAMYLVGNWGFWILSVITVVQNLNYFQVALEANQIKSL